MLTCWEFLDMVGTPKSSKIHHKSLHSLHIERSLFGELLETCSQMVSCFVMNFLRDPWHPPGWSQPKYINWICVDSPIFLCEEYQQHLIHPIPSSYDYVWLIFFTDINWPFPSPSLASLAPAGLPPRCWAAWNSQPGSWDHRPRRRRRPAGWRATRRCCRRWSANTTRDDTGHGGMGRLSSNGEYITL